MQHELFFVSSAPLMSPQAAFDHYFEGRANYKVTRGLARYENDDTGVGFTFDCTGETVVAPGTPRPWARFIVELLRPSFFAEEATREIEPFVRHFESGVLDVPGAPPAPYSPATFLRNWHAASRTEYARAQAAAEQSGVPLSRMSRAALTSAWRWNFHRRVLQSHEGDGLFVPRIWFLRTGGGMATSVIWPEAMAARVPQVDYVIFSRGAFAPPRRGSSDVVLVPWEQVIETIKGSAAYDSLGVSWRVVEPEMLDALGTVISTVTATKQLPDLVPLDTVLDVEGFPEQD